MRQIEADNLNLIASMDRAFRQVGSHRNRYDDGFARRFGIERGTRIAPALKESFDEVVPNWVSITHRVDNPVDSAHMADFGLILTEAELADLTGFMEDISARQLDRVGETEKDDSQVRRVRRVRRELRGVPVDAQLELVHSREAETLSDREYAQTRPVRRYLKRTYLSELRRHVVDGRRRRLTLSQAHEYITTAPTVYPALSATQIRHLCRKRRLTDAELDVLLRYFEAHLPLLEKLAAPAGEFNGPDGETYFLVPYEVLP